MLEKRHETIKESAKTRKIYMGCKEDSRDIVSRNLLWWVKKYYSNDASEVLTDQEMDGLKTRASFLRHYTH